jgi:hypothetical protein
VDDAIVVIASAANVELVVVISETTRTLAAATVTLMSDGFTPSRSDAMLFLYAVWLNSSIVPATTAVNVTLL